MILVVVGRLTKYSHFMALPHPYSAPLVEKIFMDQVYKLHGLPTDIISDRGAVLISAFWKEMMTQLMVQLKLSTSYHPQTDDQTEVVNKRNFG